MKRMRSFICHRFPFTQGANITYSTYQLIFLIPKTALDTDQSERWKHKGRVFILDRSEK
jgi:hypothetical protein